MHRRTFLLASLALFAPAPLLAAEADAAATLTAIYKRVSAGKGNKGGGFISEPKANRPKYLSKSLIALWAAAEKKTKPDDVGPVDFDPLSNSQDPLVLAFLVKTEKQDANSATVSVSLSDKKGKVTPDKDNTLTFAMVREGGRWLIDNISGTAGGDPWDFRQMLTSYEG